MKMNKFAEEVHQNAVEHGWWDEPRTFGEIVALCHSELSEAMEEFRAKLPMFWQHCQESKAPCDREYCGDWSDGVCEINALGDKPEGIAVELADCIIRILDLIGRWELSADNLMGEAKNIILCDVPARIYDATLGDCIARWHLLLSLAYSCWCRRSGTWDAALRMAMCINEILEWAEENGVDMEMVLEVKHEYNKGRPYRHGGKAL